MDRKQRMADEIHMLDVWLREHDGPISDLVDLVRDIGELQKELDVTDELLNTRNRLLDAIPECPAHGHQCVPHAIEWVEAMKKSII